MNVNMAQNMWFRYVGRIFLAIHTKDPPSDEEWDAALVGMREWAQGPGRPCTLVFTDGGAPNTAQRQRLQKALNGKDLLIAVLSGALIPRFVNASIALFNKSIRSFTPDEFPQARQHLMLTEQELKQLRETFSQVQAEMGSRKVAALERAMKA
jgi:hypothetical protein